MFTFYLKPTDRCNLFCDHCFVPLEAKQKSQKLSVEVINALCDFIEKLGEPQVHVIWHGGEPLFYGVDLIEEYSSIIRSKLGNRVIFSLQTNLICDQKELGSLVRFVKEYTNSNIGTSFDFEIRKYRNSFELFKQIWYQNVKFLVKNDIFVNVVITITKLVSVDKLFSFIREMKNDGVKSFHLERFTPSGNGLLNKDRLYLNHREFFGFLEEVLERYIFLLKEGFLFRLNPFDKMVKSYFFGKGGGCFSGDCMSRMITISPDGSVSNCPDLAFYEEYTFGNLLTDPPEKILLNKKRLHTIKYQETFICLDCEYFNICHGGCPHHFFGFDRESCKKFFRTFTENVNILYEFLCLYGI
ncbi:MAG: radical SAM protein [candidate division WOR-3 bacterium]